MRRELGLWLIIGVVGLATFVTLYPHAFPEASIDFRISRHQALDIGEQTLKQLGSPDLSGYRRGVDFHWDERAKRYLEKTMGLAIANAVMQRGVSVWHWFCRWVLPGDRHEYLAAVTPDGQVIYAEIRLPEEMPGAVLPESQARTVAENFVRMRLGLNLREWKLIATHQFKRPNRLDYNFTYEHRHKKFPTKHSTPATVRFWVTVSGDKVTGYRLRRLHVPEQWQFEERRRQTLRSILVAVSGVVYAFLLFALLLFVLRMFGRKEPILWQVGFYPAALLFALTFATGLNFAQFWWMHYDPAQPLGAFVTWRLVFMLLQALFSAIAVLVFVLPAERLTHDHPPAGISLGIQVRPAFWCTKEATFAIVVGFCLGLTHLGYVTAFYRLGQKIGVWVPLDIPYTDAVATPLPFLVPLFDGLKPALSEELFFRLAAVYLLWRWTGRRWLAVLLPNIIWSFLHTGYPPEPAFTRGIELTIVALVYTWVVFRYGIVASIAAHYTCNAVLTAHLLLRAEEPYLRLSGIIASLGMLWLLLPAAITFIRHRRLLTVAELSPVMPTPPPQPVVAEIAYAPYQPISRKAWSVLAVLAAIGFGTTLYPTERFKVLSVLQVNRTEAKRIASDYLKGKGVSVERYWVAARFFANLDEDSPEAAYILEHAGEATLHRFWQEHLPRVYWQVRFFRPLEREEWFVRVGIDGRVLGHWHMVPEEAQGAKLALSEARKRAETYLHNEFGVDLKKWHLVEADKTERLKRLDWLFTYEHKTFRVNEAPLRMRVSVQGGEAQGFTAWLKVPEAWSFEREQFGAWTHLTAVWLLVLLLISYGCVTVVEWREGTTGFNWRLGLKVALAFTPLALLQMLNGTEGLWMAYRTTVPPLAFLLRTVLILGLWLSVVFLMLLCVGSWEPWMKVRLPEMVPLSLWLSRRHKDPVLAQTPLIHPAAWRDAVLFSYLTSFSFIGLFGDSVMNAWLVRNSWLPALDYLAWTVWGTLILFLVGILVAGTYRRYIRKPQRLSICLLFLIPLGLLGTHSLMEAMHQLIEWVAFLVIATAILYWLGRFVLRHNLYAWALGIALPMLLAMAVELLQAKDPFMKAQAIPLLFVYLLPALTLLRRRPATFEPSMP